VANHTYRSQGPILEINMSEFWSAHLGLTLITVSLVVLVFVITPLREAGLAWHIFFDLATVTLMIFGAMTLKQSQLAKAFAVSITLATAIALGAGRLHPTLPLHLLGSVLVTVTLLVYIRIVLLVMFRKGPVTWSRIQGGVCAYLLLGMAWASAFQFIEQLHPGSFYFSSTPMDIDQLSSKLTYFSFATLTTVGSTIAPLNPFARSLTIAEAVAGQLFPATLIGALVTMAMQATGTSRPRLEEPS
jgi:hypothetical protein